MYLFQVASTFAFYRKTQNCGKCLEKTDLQNSQKAQELEVPVSLKVGVCVGVQLIQLCLVASLIK